jgi:uncharacterized protein YkwD
MNVRLMRKLLIAGLLALFLVAAVAPAQPADAAQNADPYYLIQLVNNLRAEYGLPPYQIDASLMAAAQAHSEWAASVGTHSHTGIGGSTPQDRAIAAGYGGGQSVRVSENIYWGTNATSESAVQWWRNSPIHFRGMTSTNYTQIGAGIAYSASGGFFTLNFGIVLDGSPPPAAPSSAGQGEDVAELPVYIVEPVEVAEPREDGSIVHVVGEGQNPWDIAEAYEVPLSEILALNRLTDDSIIRPGDELIIQPAPVEAITGLEPPVYHTVEPGQTLYGIALRYDVDLATLLTLNQLSENAVIRPGDELLIIPDPDQPLPPLIHVVEEGQTLSGIALRYGLTVERLRALNGLSEDAFIHPGDRIIIRPGDSTSTPPPPTPTPTPLPPQPTATQAVSAARTVAPAPDPPSDAGIGSDANRRAGGSRWVLVGGVALIGLAGIALMVKGFLMKE